MCDIEKWCQRPAGGDREDRGREDGSDFSLLSAERGEKSGEWAGDNWMRPEADGLGGHQRGKPEPHISEPVGMAGTKPRNSGQSRFGRKKTI